MGVDQSVLDKLRGAEERVEEHRTGGSDVEWFKPTKGDYTVRILPDKDLGNNFFTEVWAHWGVGPKGDTRITCPNLTEGAGLPCAICEAIEELKASGDKDDKKIADRITPNPQFMVAMVDRDKMEDGVKVWTAPPTVLKIWRRDIQDEGLTFWSIDEGTDFIISLDTSKQINDYSMSRFKRKDTPLADTDTEMVAIIEQIPDLAELITYPSYDETLAAMTGSKVEEESVPAEEEPVEAKGEGEGESDVMAKLNALRGN